MKPTKKQQRFLDLISEGKNVFLTGKASPQGLRILTGGR